MEKEFNVDRITGFAYGSSGVTIGLSLFSWQTLGIIVGILSTVILTTVTLYIKIKAYKNSNEGFKQDMIAKKLEVDLLKERLTNEKRKDIRNGDDLMRCIGDNRYNSQYSEYE